MQVPRAVQPQLPEGVKLGSSAQGSSVGGRRGQPRHCAAAHCAVQCQTMPQQLSCSQCSTLRASLGRVMTQRDKALQKVAAAETQAAAVVARRDAALQQQAVQGLQLATAVATRQAALQQAVDADTQRAEMQS